MLRAFSIQYLSDDRGGLTVVGLLWIMLLAGICGLAVDSTNGFRNRAMLEATADAAALAAVIDLPNNNAAITAAVAYSRGNMPAGQYGDVLRVEDVKVGSWDSATRSFNADGVAPDPDAVSVRMNQTEGSVTAALINALRVVGFRTGEINVEAVAQRYIPHCVQNGSRG